MKRRVKAETVSALFFSFTEVFKKKTKKKQVGDFMVKKRKNIKHTGSNINRSSDKRKEKQ